MGAPVQGRHAYKPSGPSNRLLTLIGLTLQSCPPILIGLDRGHHLLLLPPANPHPPPPSPARLRSNPPPSCIKFPASLHSHARPCAGLPPARLDGPSSNKPYISFMARLAFHASLPCSACPERSFKHIEFLCNHVNVVALWPLMCLLQRAVVSRHKVLNSETLTAPRLIPTVLLHGKTCT